MYQKWSQQASSQTKQQLHSEQLKAPTLATKLFEPDDFEISSMACPVINPYRFSSVRPNISNLLQMQNSARSQ